MSNKKLASVALLSIFLRFLEILSFEVTSLTGIFIFLFLNIMVLSVAKNILFLLDYFTSDGNSRMFTDDLVQLASRTIDITIIALAIIIIVEEILGTLGVLTKSVLLFAFIILSSLSILMEYILPKYFRCAKRQQTTQHVLFSLDSSQPFFGVLAGLLLASVAQPLYAKWITPPLDDALGYHLPFAVEWLQKANLSMPVPSAGDPSTPFYPLNSSLWMYWFIVPFETDILVRFIQIPFVFLLVLGIIMITYEIAWRTTGNMEIIMSTSAVLLITLPEFLRNMFVVGNDVIVSSLLIIATSKALSLLRNFAKTNLILGSASLGLALGTKVLALPYVIVLACIYIAVIIKKTSGRTRWMMLMLVTVITLALGGYSYLRNALVMKNPFYPVTIQVEDYVLWRGLYAVTDEWKQFHPFYQFDWKAFLLGDHKLLGVTIPIWILPGLIWAIWFAVKWSNLQVLLLILLTLSGIGIFWYILPYHFVRYMFFVIALAVIIATWGWYNLVEKREYLVKVFQVGIIALIGFNIVNIPMNTSNYVKSIIYWIGLVIVFAIGLILFHVRGMLVDNYISIKRNKQLTKVGLILGIGALIILWSTYNYIYETNRFSMWKNYEESLGAQPEAWKWLDRTTLGDGAGIVVIGTNVVYPIYGSRFQNRILHVRLDGSVIGYNWGQPLRLSEYSNVDKWLDSIAKEKVDFLYITRHVVTGKWPVEDEWAANNPERFVLCFSNKEVHIWCVRSDSHQTHCTIDREYVAQ